MSLVLGKDLKFKLDIKCDASVTTKFDLRKDDSVNKDLQ